MARMARQGGPARGQAPNHPRDGVTAMRRLSSRCGADADALRMRRPRHGGTQQRVQRASPARAHAEPNAPCSARTASLLLSQSYCE